MAAKAVEKKIPFKKSRFAFLGDYFVSMQDGRVFHFLLYKINGNCQDGSFNVDMWVSVYNSLGNLIENKFIKISDFDRFVEKGVLVKQDGK